MIVPNNKPTKAPNIQKDLNTYIYKKVYAMDGPELRLCLIEFTEEKVYQIIIKETENDNS